MVNAINERIRSACFSQLRRDALSAALAQLLSPALNRLASGK